MSDIFKQRKLVHVKLDKDMHYALKVELLKADITMQEFFSEFCRLYVNGSSSVRKVVENYLARKNKYKLEDLRREAENLSKAIKNKDAYAEIDRDIIYDMLDEESPLNDSEEKEDV